jgi:D-2-hydroxyacid dehydrogenase (NADP+)
MTTVASTLNLTAQQRAAILETGASNVVTIDKAGISPSGTDLEDTEVWLGGDLTGDLVTRMPRLRWVQATSAGVDAFPMQELASRHVTLTNVRGMHADTVADHALGLVLALARSLPGHLRHQWNHEWTMERVRELAGTRMTIIGMGAIGQAIGQRARAFEVELTAVTRSGVAPAGVQRAFPHSGLLEAVADADWVVSVLPLTEETRGLIGSAVFEAMRSNAAFISIGRGPVVDEEALVSALRDRAIGAAALDVFETEPLAASSPLWDMANVIITPHVGGIQTHFKDRAVAVFCRNLKRYLAGQSLENVIDLERGY